MSRIAKFGILRNCITKLIKLKINKISWDKGRQRKIYYRILLYFLLIYGLQKVGFFSENFLLYLWKWNVRGTPQISLQFLKVPNLAVCDIFSWKIYLHLTYFFSKCLLYLVLSNEQRNLFLVMVAIETKNKVFLWFSWQRSLRKKMLHLFQKANVEKYSLSVSVQRNHYFFRKNVTTGPFAPCC